MTIRDVLADKGHRVETIWPERTVADVIARFDDRGISSVVVTDHAGQPIGIVTDRDVLRGLARRGAKVLTLPVHEFMQSPVPTCRTENTVAEIMHRMTLERIRHVAVVDDQGLKGIVSIGDLVKSRLQDADLESRVLREQALSRLAME
jgi:CBS domain-containing protein